MIEPLAPIYQWGQRVAALVDLYNDGSYPDQPGDILLVSQGEQGEVVQVGTITETNAPIYLVEFQEGRVVGCIEEELGPV